jgi:hypothetical protein
VNTDTDEPEDEPSEEGTDDDASIVYDYETFTETLWSNSFNADGSILTECGGYKIGDRYQLLDCSNNKTNFTSFEYFRFPGDVRVYTLLPDGTYEAISGIIHTHPTPVSSGGHPEPTSPDDWNCLAAIGGNSPGYQGVIKGEVVSENGTYTYYFEEDGSRTYIDPNGRKYKNQ